MSAAEQYSPQQRKKFQRTAILSAWFGCVSEQLLDSNSMIILYLITLGGDESFSMFSTAISAICGIFMNIICAGIISKTGLRASYSTAVFGSAGAFLLMAAAPSIVPIEYAKYLLFSTTYGVSTVSAMCGYPLSARAPAKSFSWQVFPRIR